MEASNDTFEKTLRMADSIGDYKGFFSQSHCKLLVDEALKGTRATSEKVEFIVALARRCKTGLVSAEQLAEQIDKLYSLGPIVQQHGEGAGQAGLGGGQHDEAEEKEDAVGGRQQQQEEEKDVAGKGQQQEGEEEMVGMTGGVADGTDNVHDKDSTGVEEDEDDEEETTTGEGESPPLDENVKELLEMHSRNGRGFFSAHKWPTESKPFVLPGEGYWKDAHHIQLFRNSTYEDFASATPKPMPVYIPGNPWCSKVKINVFSRQKHAYIFCKKVAVSSDGKIFRATDAEIESALASKDSAPKVNAAMYVKLAQEARLCHAAATTLKNGISGKKRRR